ncbi:MAG: CARDB domain-containing protein, partial [Bacteroidota bacterium]
VQLIGNGCISPAPTITGPSSICGIPSTGNVYITEASMSGYFWNVSAGGLITAGLGTNTITVSWMTSGVKTVSVNYINNNGCFAANPTSYPVHVYALPIPAITGPAPICDLPSTGNVYITEPGMSGYSWTVSSGGTITSGAGTNAITITWNTVGTQSVGIIYTDNNGCTAANATVKTIPVYGLLPVSIIIEASANPACSDNEVTFTATPLNGGTAPFYQWKINGLYVGVNSATYSYIPIDNDVVTCTLTSSLSCTTGNPATSNPVTMTVNATPAAPASGGNQNVCSTALPATLSSTAPGGTAVDWYNAPAGGSLLLANSATYSASTAGNYYAESRNTTTGCASAVRTAITLAINQAIQYFADADGDGYGNPAVFVFACSQPAGYVANNADCNDNNPDINPGDQYFSYSGNVGFTSSIVTPAIGSSYTLFHFEADYYDATNTLPMAGYPRLILDYEGNGSYTDPNDRILMMTPYDLSDVNTMDGKRYVVNVNGLPYGTTWKAQLIVSDGNYCTTTFGPFDYPDVMQQPNLSIFANDITFSNSHPDPSQNITVSAVIHNESDFEAQNFQVHLISQYDASLIYPDVAVASIAPHGSATVQWNVTTPSVPAWCPMQVIVDYTNVIDETNELDNSAVRPFVNGNFQVAGSIVCTSSVSPSVSYSNPDNFLLLSGSAFYSGLAVPLPDSSVAGATVSFQVTETGATFSGYTNSSGYFNIYFLAPVAGGSYHITGTITDYTLTGEFSSHFTIISKPNLSLTYCQSVDVRPVNPQYPGTATLVA